jgi:hypothetical protein
MARVDRGIGLALAALVVTSVYFVVDNHLPLYPWNNLPEAGPQLASTLSLVIPYAATAAALLARSRWATFVMTVYCWVLLGLQIATWYPAYLFGARADWYAENGYDQTVRVLPRVGDNEVVVDAQHTVLQFLTLATAIAVTVATVRLWRSSTYATPR